MKYYGAVTTKDTKKDGRRSRHILANSGDIMESGEIRDLDALYVMGRDANLIKVSDLAKNPEKQAEDYSVKALANHGELIDGELVGSIEKQFGSCKVWLEDGQLHAMMYFADDDDLADHAYAISKDASYSVGIDWFPDGYRGAGLSVDETIGILREISMVVTGNDPRAKTIDHLTDKTAGAKGSEAVKSGDGVINEKGDSKMAEKTKDELTPDENRAMKERLAGEIADKIVQVVDEFTTNAPEDQTQPTATDKKDAEETEKKDAEPEADEKTTDSVKSMPFVVVRDRAVKNVRTTDTVKNYLKSEKSVDAWGRALLASRGDAKAWRDNFRAIAKKDGITLGNDVEIAPEAVINAVAEQMRDSDTLFAHVNKTGLAFEVVAIPTVEQGATGHVRGRTKVEEANEAATRVLTPADLYKLMKLDHSMVKLNGGLGSSAIVRYVLRELPRKLIETIDKAILVGGVMDDAATPAAFTALNPILGDITTSNSIYGGVYTATAGDNLRQTISKAANRVTASADRTLVATADFLADLENATTEGGQLLFPNGISKTDPRINGITRIITPIWLTPEMMNGHSAIIVALGEYHTVGDATPEEFTDYDIDTNKYVWEQVACIGGGLANKNAAVAIASGVSA